MRSCSHRWVWDLLHLLVPESPTEAPAVPNSPIKQDDKVGRLRGWGFFPSLLKVMCVIMQMRQAKCMQKEFAVFGCRGEGGWLGKSRFSAGLHRANHVLGGACQPAAARDMPGQWSTVNCSHVSSPTISLTHFHSMLPYSVPMSSHYSCVSNVIASFTFPTTEPITFLTFPHFPLICITDMFVF